MKNLIVIISALFIGATTSGQILKPVTWSYAGKKTANKEGIIYMKAIIEPGWHIYSQQVAKGGPVKTGFTFNPSKAYKLVGSPQEPKPVTTFEKVFNMQVSYFSNSVIFQQKVQFTNSPVVVTGSIEYMACNDQKCLTPEEVDFSIPLK
ncbi:sugar transporter [Adhaeribacter arboris]|uniref:Sugar transporter n=1 Tax=Adhaeribacter arboris TaxID=2072846 RepID=A0A2T2Y8Y8_9BACT|nr:protein-disulfide reductase DsbD domain-containing protein [Adhaeribacter arboris]PSR51980.1 sugar transporter [Adhaeribacter arboris]